MSLALQSSHGPLAAVPSAEGSPAGTTIPLAYSDLSHSSPNSHSPGSSNRTDTFQRPAEASAVPHAAAAKAAAAALAQAEEEERQARDPDISRRGGLRCLGQYYATQLNRRTMAHLCAELKLDGELRQEFEKLLAKDAVDWKAWEEMTKWTFPESDESDDEYDAQHHGNYA
ncbi:hypothetical protein D9Q98_003610 [Chlorella vulgaris]|uniref:Uncharacterized protein n=1 Tax=Chlorella vulgaris TaxID=3077 RepID=A0A9D4TSY4_CHLVU|nr:hypothetical protein D9Q98_003610 [Chlorella vulgaris]